MVAAADPSGIALSPQEWKANRWLEGWIHTPRSTTTYLEGQKYVMANAAYPMLMNIYDTCATGDISVPSRTGTPAESNSFPRSWTVANVSDAACPELIKTANSIMQEQIYDRHMVKCPHDNTLVTIQLDPTLSAKKIFANYPERAARAEALLSNKVRARETWLERNRSHNPSESPAKRHRTSEVSSCFPWLASAHYTNLRGLIMSCSGVLVWCREAHHLNHRTHWQQ